MIELNCDLGESYGLFHIGDDEGVMPFIDTANIACGFHGGDPEIIRHTLRLAKSTGVRCGAHPSLPDLQGFGRREMRVGRQELSNIILYQVGALRQMMEVEGVRLNHLKPHGALYGMINRDPELAAGMADAIQAIDRSLPWIVLPGSQAERVGAQRGIPLIREFFADLDYDRTGALIITRKHDAVDPSRAADKVQRMLEEGVVETVEGDVIPMRAESICVHSDTPGAAAIAKAVRGVIDRATAVA